MGNAFQIAGLVLIGVGILLILLGAYMSLRDWNRRREGLSDAERNAISGALDGLTKLAAALKSYPIGQQLIVWGILIEIIGGSMGGIGGLK